MELTEDQRLLLMARLSGTKKAIDNIQIMLKLRLEHDGAFDDLEFWLNESIASLQSIAATTPTK